MSQVSIGHASTNSIKRKAVIRSLFRGLLREITYLPDPKARQDIRGHVVKRFRASINPHALHAAASATDSESTHSLSRRDGRIKAAKHYLQVLYRANHGHRPALNLVFGWTYGRNGPQRHVMLDAIKTHDPPRVSSHTPDLISSAVGTPSALILAPQGYSTSISPRIEAIEWAGQEDNSLRDSEASASTAQVLLQYAHPPPQDTTKWVPPKMKALEGGKKDLPLRYPPALTARPRPSTQELGPPLEDALKIIDPNTKALESMVLKGRPRASRPPPPVLSQRLQALAKSQTSNHSQAHFNIRSAKLDRPIPTKNTWGGPMAPSRIRNMKISEYARTLSRLLPPLSEEEWEKLRQKVTGEILFQGVKARRPTASLRKVSPNESKTVTTSPSSYKPHWRGPYFSSRSLSRPHRITKRFVRRRLQEIFFQTPRIGVHPKTGKWLVQWGGPADVGRCDVERVPLSLRAGLFSGVDDQGKLLNIDRQETQTKTKD